MRPETTRGGRVISGIGMNLAPTVVGTYVNFNIFRTFNICYVLFLFCWVILKVQIKAYLNWACSVFVITPSRAKGA